MIPSNSPMILNTENSQVSITYYGPSLILAEDDNMSVLSAGGVNGATYVCSSYSGEADETTCPLEIRPVVIVDPNIKITGGDGNDSSTAYQLDLSKY